MNRRGGSTVTTVPAEGKPVTIRSLICKRVAKAQVPSQVQQRRHETIAKLKIRPAESGGGGFHLPNVVLHSPA